MGTTVIVKQVSNLLDDLRECLGELHFHVTDQDFVVIKPNLCDFTPPTEGGTTDPQIIEAIIKIIRETANPIIAIVESDHALATADEEFERLGYTRLAQELDVQLVNLSKEPKHELYLGGYFLQYFKASETLLRMTKLISVAKLKTHTQHRITCAMKNHFGLVPQRSKSKYHPFMSEVLVDLNEVFRPDLCIIDGLVGMEGPGPTGGIRRDLGVVVCARDAFSCDVVAARIMGINPRSVPVLKFAEHKGLGSFDQVGVVSDTDTFEKFVFIPAYVYYGYRIAFFLDRLAYKAGKSLASLSEFLSQFATGLYIVAKGHRTITGYGTVFKDDVISYGRSLLLRVLIRIKLKVYRIT